MVRTHHDYPHRREASASFAQADPSEDTQNMLTDLDRRADLQVNNLQAIQALAKPNEEKNTRVSNPHGSCIGAPNTQRERATSTD